MERDVELREALRRLRAELGLTQEQMSRRIGITTRSAARWESGSVDSLPPGQLINLRHLAIQTENEELAEYFHELLMETYATGGEAAETEAAVYELMPNNLPEWQAVSELLHRMREDDPAIRPVVSQIAELRKQRQEEERKEEERRRASMPKPRPLRERLMNPPPIASNPPKKTPKPRRKK